MKTFWQALGAVMVIAASLSCSDVKFQSKSKDPSASCVGTGCPTPYTYAWHEAGYNGSCSLACGGGIETQTVTCRRVDGVTVPDGNCSGTKPASSRSCNVQSCTTTYNWNISPWSICTKACGGGSQTRTVFCQTDTGTTVADSYCTNPKPVISQACNSHPCPPGTIYGWQWVPGQCSQPCGGGFEKYICKRNDDVTVADSNCTDPKPSVACNTHACTTVYTYAWVTGSWTVCSKSCGSGTRTRDVTCQRNDGQYVTDSYCAGQSQPTSQELCNTQACPSTGRDVTTTKTVPLPAVDVIMIVDDSASMAPENAKLAQRMGGFITDLDAANIDYRVCITTTDVGRFAGSPLVWGTINNGTWVPSTSHLITNETPNKPRLFTDSLTQVGHGWSSDEQGIKALWLMLKDYGGSGCFRTGATLATILISDENERSVGGNQSWSSAQYKPLTTENYPATLINAVKAKFGANKKFLWNSIIVKPGDTACEAAQDAQGVPCFFGTLYNELSNLTGGYAGSICASDYTQNLKLIKDRVVASMPSVLLECVPTNTPTVTITPAYATNITVDNNLVRFNPALPEGRTVRVQYRCPN